MPQKFHLSLLIHAHQPCGNFEHVLEKAYDSSYLPFIEHLEKHPKVHLGLHYSGPLLTWIEQHRPEYFVRLKKLVQSGQVELVGGGFYEPILVSIRPEDQHEQIARLAAYLEKHFGKLPSGAWLAERVWEPQLPTALASANVAYTLVDDMHFLAAGFEPEELFGPYIAEDRGKAVWLYPGQKALRYLIPFGRSKTSSPICAMPPPSTRVAWPPWAMTWKNSASGLGRTNIATRMAGSPLSLPRWKKIPIGWKSPPLGLIWNHMRLSAAPICPPHPIPR